MRQRGERIERSFAHLYDTGGMRRTHLRGHENILKRLLIHAGGFNLGLIMRHAIGVGTPRGLQGHVGAVLALLFARLGRIRRRLTAMSCWQRPLPVTRRCGSAATPVLNWSANATFTTGFHEKAGRCQGHVVLSCTSSLRPGGVLASETRVSVGPFGSHDLASIRTH